MTNNTVTLHRVLKASPEKVFRAFTEPNALSFWFPPYGFLCVVHQMDVRVGGSYKMSFTNFSTGNGHSFGGIFLEINFFTQQRLENNVNGNLTNPKNGNEIIFSLSAESKDEVNKWFEKIKAIGGMVFCEPQNYEKGYTFGFADPDGHKSNVLYWPGM